MTDYIIATDTGSDLSQKQYEKYGIVPIYMCYEQDGKVQTADLSKDGIKRFYDGMREGASPKTSSINPEEFRECFEQMGDKPILFISMGSGISGSYANAVSASRLVKNEVRVIDSKGASLMAGMLAVRASKNRDSGMPLDENARDITAMRERVNVFYTTSTLEYLCRGGRVSRAGAVIGGMLGINPILSVDGNGKLYVKEKIRGKKNTEQRLFELVRDAVDKRYTDTLFYNSSDDKERADIIAKRLTDTLAFSDSEYSDIGCVIGSHAGPGLVAYYFF